MNIFISIAACLQEALYQPHRYHFSSINTAGSITTQTVHTYSIVYVGPC